MAVATDIGTLITHTAGIHGGRPHIAGTGVTVQRVVVWYKMGLTPEEIAERIGHLTLAQVYGALTYYHANRDAIETDIEAEDAAYSMLEREHHDARQQRQ